MFYPVLNFKSDVGLLQFHTNWALESYGKREIPYTSVSFGLHSFQIHHKTMLN